MLERDSHHMDKAFEAEGVRPTCNLNAGVAYSERQSGGGRRSAQCSMAQQCLHLQV